MVIRNRYKKAVKEICKEAVVFARVSSERQEKGASIEAQKESIYDYCNKHSLSIIKEYEITESTTRGDRKKYNDMLDFIRTRKRKTAIVVNCVDRLQRSDEDNPALNKLRKEGKIVLHFMKENIILDEDSPVHDIFAWKMNVLMAGNYTDSLSYNVKRSQIMNWSLGKWQDFAPIGYLNAKDENYHSTLIIDEVRAPIIQKLFEEYATGMHSIGSIWELAKKMGLYSKMKSRRAHLVSKNTVYDILTNPFYYGEMCIKGDFMPHIYPPLISRALFDKVQDTFVEKGNHNRCNVENETKHTYAFRKLIRCKECGGWITPATAIKKNGLQYKHLRCRNNNHGCHQSSVMEYIIVDQLEKEVFSKISIPLNLQETVKEQILHDLNDTAKLNATIKTNITKKLNELQVLEDNLLDLRIKGDITQEQYERKNATITKEKKGLIETREKYKIIDNDTKNKIINIFSTIGNISYLFKNATPTRQNELLKMLLQDCKLSGSRLEYTLRKPFDMLIKNNNHKEWPNIAVSHLNDFVEVGG